MNCGTVSRKCTSGAGPTAPVADAPGSAMDTPTTPATGTAFFKRFICFCFVRGIVEASHAFWWYAAFLATRPSPLRREREIFDRVAKNASVFLT
jgi:hypothetical protein